MDRDLIQPRTTGIFTSYAGFRFLLAFLALAAGGAIYVFLRAPEFVFFGWIESAGFGNWLEAARTRAVSGSMLFPAWVVFSLTSGLWAFACTVIIRAIWFRSRSRLRYVWMAAVPLLVFGFEGLQLTGIRPGTFCPWDLAMGLTGIVLGYFITTHTLTPRTHEKAIES